MNTTTYRKPNLQAVSLRINANVLKTVRKAAYDEGISINKFIGRILLDWENKHLRQTGMRPNDNREVLG